MNDDALLAKMLDGTLSPAERQTLAARKAISVELAEEAEQLADIEHLLVNSDMQFDRKQFEFLRAFEDRVADIIATEGSPAVESQLLKKSTSGTQTKAQRPAWYRIGMLLIVPFLFNALQMRSSNVVPDAEAGIYGPMPVKDQMAVFPPTTLADPLELAPIPAKTRTATGSKTSTLAKEEESEDKRTQNDKDSLRDTSTSKEGRSDVVNASVSLPTLAERVSALVSTLEGRLLDARASNDRALEAICAQKIGLLYRQCGREFSAIARQYLEQALRLARSSGLREVEAKALGEIALLEAQEGNRLKAALLLNECILLLEEGGFGNAQRWRHELQELHNNL